MLREFYRRKLRRKQKKGELGRSDGALSKSPSESSVNSLATGLISRVLRFTGRRSEPPSRPHSWHSTKLGEGQPEPSMMQISQGSMGAPWHQTYHSSASTTDLSSYEPAYLRKSPDQYSSRGSMESLDPPHPAYSSCLQLSTSKSSNSIDHLHSKRDSAYSSFSTSSSIPEYLAAAPSFSKERSCSMETVPQRGGAGGRAEGMQQADIRYVRTVYDPQQGVSQEHEVSSASAALLRNSEVRGGGGASRASHRGSSSSSSSSSGGSVGGVNSASNRHSVGPIWGQSSSRSSYENLKGAPAPPMRSDSYAAIRNHERPNSWSSLEQARSLRALHKGSWHHSSGSVASGKGSYGAEGQLHTVIEKSPESSPTTKPKQGGFPPQSASQSGRFMLPMGIYPVPLPEPHFAQMPTSCPSSSSVYPALAKEKEQHPQAPLEVSVDGVAMENGYQSNPPSVYSPSPSPSPSLSPSNQLYDPAHHKPPVQQAAKAPQEPQTKCGLYRPHLKSGGTEGQTLFPRQSQVPSQVQGQEYRPSTAHSIVQERRDPYTPVLSRGERSRPCQSPEQPEPHHQAMEEEQVRPIAPHSGHLDPAPMVTRVAQGQVPQGLRGGGSSSSTNPYQVAPHLRHHTDSGTFHPQQKEHPLTRLQNALAEVQQCASPGTSTAHSLSVLEKVSHFERREKGKQRSQSASHASNNSHHGPLSKTNQSRERAKSALSSMEDLRLMLDRSNSPSNYRSLSSSSYGSSMASQEGQMTQRRGSSDKSQHRNHRDLGSVLQRSRSTFQLGEETDQEEVSWKGENPWQEGLQDLLGSIQDTSYNRSYRDSLKDAQSKVLRSTSFRRRDLSVSVSANSSPPPVPVKHLSLERRGPKTSPKPSISVPPPTYTQTPSPIQVPATSPHTPKERHMVTPEVRGISPPELPSVPPVGPPSRIGGRKRLTMEQKKRSYSEPENMHEVGMLDTESYPCKKGDGQQFLFSDTSVANRRKMFEMAASRSLDPQTGVAKPDLRQLQQDALADYVERKRGRRPEGRPHRPRSAYLHPEASSTAADTRSLSSTSSLLSLLEPSSESFSGTDRLCSTLPPNLQGFSYPTRSSVRPQAYPDPDPSRQNTQALAPGPVLTQAPEIAQAKRSLGLSQQRNGAFERSAPARSSGKSASAENLLERSEKKLVPQHFRSRSSPSVEGSNQDILSGDLRMFGIFSTEPEMFPISDPRSVESPRQGSLSLSQQRMERYLLKQGPSQVNTPVMRRERQRNADRQRAHSASGLAASVGLPCPFSPPGGSTTSLDWQASERLSQANLDAIAFPGLGQGGTATAALPNQTSGDESEGGGARPGVLQGVTRQSSSESGASEETLKDFPREGPCPETPITPPKTSPPPPPPHRTSRKKPLPPLEASAPPHVNTPPPKTLMSLRISESSLQVTSPSAFVGEEYDEVFIQDLPPPPLPIRETDITEDFPPPPPTVLAPPPLPDWEESSQSDRQHNSSSECVDPVGSESQTASSPQTAPCSPVPAPPTPSQTPEPEPHPPSCSTTACEDQESLGLEYQLLSRRERSAEELRVEALARQLVSRDGSLSPLLDTWAGKNTLDLMEDIFPNHTGGREPWQRRGSSWLESRTQEIDCCTGHAQSAERGIETDLDEEEADVNHKKVELLQALALSITVLRCEREGLAEEQRRYELLGSNMDALVQERCKPNERDKYRMFIGDLDKIVNLLLSLCGRLARIDNSLSALEKQEENEGSAGEKELLLQKRQQLCSQQVDARELKENLDRRERVVLDFLGGYLSGPQLREYQHFVRVKPALLIRLRHLDELIRQEEEQLNKLAESLPPSHQPPPSSISAPRPGSTHTVRSTTVTSL